MRRAATVWMAAARQIIWKLFLVIIVMAAAEIILIRQYIPAAEVINGVSFGRRLESAGLRHIYCGAVVALTLILCWQGMDRSGSRTKYTLQRLSVGEPAVTTLWAAFHVGCYVILWAVQILLVLFFWRRYQTWWIGHEAPQLELFVEFYLDGFLHSLLPMADLYRWLRVGSFVLCIGTATAYYGFAQRRGKLFPAALPIAVVNWVFFGQSIGYAGMDVFLFCVHLAMLSTHLLKIWRGEDEKT